MAISIFNIDNFNSSIGYNIHNVVKNEGKFYYALRIVPPGSSINDISLWGGLTIFNGITKPRFLWNTSYNSPANQNPRIKSIQFSDGYEQRFPDGINNNLLQLELSFETRTYDEAFAILHFFHAREGAESFVYKAHPPYSVDKLYICREWTHTESFRDNHSIKARFLERGN
ncbi:MAG: phage tail protein [Nanoarchaeota archaeon]